MEQFEVHDPEILANARAILDSAGGHAGMAQAVVAAVERNDEWRGQSCLNLLAPEAPTSPTVRRMLASEIGTRAAEGHIGRINRWFAGTQYIDEVESLCVELLKKHSAATMPPSFDGEHDWQHGLLPCADSARRPRDDGGATLWRTF